jgi:hypothetical protein
MRCGLVGTREWHTGAVSTQTVTLELDSKLISAARAAAERLGESFDVVYESALRQVLVRDFDALGDETARYQAERGISLSDDEAMALANEELRAMRAERDNA